MSHRKPPARRQGRGTRDVGTVTRLRASSAPDPPHPEGQQLLKSIVDAWQVFWASELAALVEPADRLSLGRLFRMYDIRERLERIFRKEPFAAGSTGQPVIHPSAREIASLDGRIDRLERRFGITPKGRLELGITFGAAHRSIEGLNAALEREGLSDVDDEDDPRVIDVKTRKPR